MTLHIFNPDHDLALAANLSNYTPPRAGRQLRHDLSWLPSIWAQPGDVVFSDAEAASPSWVSRIADTVTAIEPWGWNKALKTQLLRLGFSASLMPTDSQLETIRQYSHRRTAARLLSQLQMEGTTGLAVECHTLDEMEHFLHHEGSMVLKAPWSSSGRGVHFVQGTADWSRHLSWARNILAAQGSVMAEPWHDKVLDFAMEFHVDEIGHIRYDGLSLFHTKKGAYTGNLIAPESDKRSLISRYVPVSLLDSIQERIQSYLHLPDYSGCFGVDMMVVRLPQSSSAATPTSSSSYAVVPCVEINVRRTMGHVALALTSRQPASAPHQSMSVIFKDQHYELTIQPAPSM